MLASYLSVYITFLTAYLDPNMTTLVTINTHGEAHLELIMLTLSAPFIWYGSNRYLSKELWEVET